MASFAGTSAQVLQKWERDYLKEFVRESGFNPYMGKGTNNPIVVKRQLIKGGQVINIPLVSALTGSGVGTNTLVGNEEALGNYSYDLKPYWHRHAVQVTKDQQHDIAFDVLKANKDMLKIWDMDDMRDAIINSLSSVVEASGSYNAGTGHSKEVFFSEATTAQKNAWAAANQYRLLYGNAEGNYSATFATGTATIDTTDDTFKRTSVSLLKRMARRRYRTTKGDSIDLPSIRPIRTGDQGREYFVCFAGPEPFANLKADMETANLDGRPRSPESNPVFQDGDLEYDGVIIREIPEIGDYGGIGNGSTTVYPVYFMGAQALGLAWGQLPKATEKKEDDYGFIKGVGTESLWAVEKLRYNGIDHGMITGLFAAAT
jgi:hypothetical protein